MSFSLDQELLALEQRVRNLDRQAARVAARGRRQVRQAEIQFCLFTLDETLAQADAAFAYFLEYDADAQGFRKSADRFTVWDPMTGFHGQTFTRGIAFKGLPGWDRWNVIQMACSASSEDNT